MSISLERVDELLEQFKTLRIMVLGDLMLDRFIHGRVDRISRKRLCR